MSAGHFVGAERFLALATKLGPDKLILKSFTGTEGISRLFQFQLQMVSEDANLDFDRLIGQNVTFGVRLLDKAKIRYFSGYISRFAQLPSERRLARYEADVVPWLWFLSRTADCRIFQNKSIPEIVEDTFKRFGFTDFELQLNGSYEKWDYCVQYRETAFNFVSRLLEQEGIFYFFRHENGKHTLVLADSPTACQPAAEQSTFPYDRGNLRGTGDEDAIYSWRMAQELRPGRYSLGDYNFEKPSTRLDVTVDSQIDQGGNKRFEVYDYPGEYEARDAGDAWAKIRMEEEEVFHTALAGDSNCRVMSPGVKFTLSEHERRDQNGPYVLTSVVHSGDEGGFYSGEGSPGEGMYRNTFTAIPAAVRFRPPRTTPRPVVQGSQTAVVVGPSGEEIYTDEHGRVKVQFHWDRLGNCDEKSSCWIRVAQPWAGKMWGAIAIPRIGQEVIVDFLEGDPDRPIITGCVYNAVNRPPYSLPDFHTRTTLKSYSSKGGGGFNELRLEDLKGKEQIFLHAEKNFEQRTKEDVIEYIGQDMHSIVVRDRLEKVKGDQHLHTVGDKNEKVDGTVSLNAGQDMQEKAGQNYALDAGMEIHLKAGMTAVIEAGTSLTLKVGSNFVNIGPAGVFISGTMVMINSGGAAGSGSGSSPQAPSDPTEADTANPGEKTDPPPKPQPPKAVSYSAQAVSLKQAAATGAPFCPV